jgi:hypothetical protein
LRFRLPDFHYPSCHARLFITRTSRSRAILPHRSGASPGEYTKGIAYRAYEIAVRDGIDIAHALQRQPTELSKGETA